MPRKSKKPPKDKEPPIVERPFDDIVGALLRVPTKKRPKSIKKNSRSKQ